MHMVVLLSRSSNPWSTYAYALQVFQSMDTDGSGTIGFDELFEFVRGRRHCLDKRNQKVKAMKIEPPEGSGTPLEEIVWTVPTLHLLINQMLRRSHVSTLQLMESWDANGDGELSRPEVLAQIRPFFRKCLPGIWEYEVKPVAVQAFDDMDGHQRMDGQKVNSSMVKGKVDIIEMQRWLSKYISGEDKIVIKHSKHRRDSYEGTLDSSASTHTPASRRASRRLRAKARAGIAAAEARTAARRAEELEATAHRFDVVRTTQAFDKRVPINGWQDKGAPYVSVSGRVPFRWELRKQEEPIGFTFVNKANFARTSALTTTPCDIFTARIAATPRNNPADWGVTDFFPPRPSRLGSPRLTSPRVLPALPTYLPTKPLSPNFWAPGAVMR